MRFLRQPDLSAAECAVTQRLTRRVVEEIESNGGWLRFDHYMRRVLYEPGLGYYSGPAVKLGPRGDFTTAPELGDLLADALADFFEPMLAEMHSPCLLELGAGSGKLAARLTDVLRHRNLGRLRYLILETSADLRERQQRWLAGFEGIEWLDTLPATPFEGIVFGNEVADALPVAIFAKLNRCVRPVGVAVEQGRLVWRTGPPDRELDAAVAEIEGGLGRPLPDGYRSEVCLVLPAWIASVSSCIARGGLLLIDYGLTQREYYHVDRRTGTLMCHFRHRAHDDPFAVPGLQDISAWIDFSACARSAAAASLSVAGYTTQAQFLLEWMATRGTDALAALSPAARHAARTLMLPGEMGERFKLLWLTRGLGRATLPGRDFRTWL